MFCCKRLLEIISSKKKTGLVGLVQCGFVRALCAELAVITIPLILRRNRLHPEAERERKREENREYLK